MAEKLADVPALFLPRLGVYGWSSIDESCAIASILTGDPVLLVGTQGTAKSLAASKLAEALGESFVTYPADKVDLDQYLGMPDIRALQEGQMKYIETGITVWGKKFIFLDELNRAQADSQGKWFELIRSRKICGRETGTLWVWAAMNPLEGFAGTNPLDVALAGRFAFFLYPKEVLDMEESDQKNVIGLIGDEDAPALNYWSDTPWQGRVAVRPGDKTFLREILGLASSRYSALLANGGPTQDFVRNFANILNKETQGKLRLDGRRLGTLYRSLLAVWAVELAKNSMGMEIESYRNTALGVLQRSMPKGITEGGLNDAEFKSSVTGVFELLDSYFRPGGDISLVEKIYRLFITADPLKMVEILLLEDLPHLIRHRAWSNICADKCTESALLGFMALDIEAKLPGLVPSELLDMLGQKVSDKSFDPGKQQPTVEGENSVFHQDFADMLKESKTPFTRLYCLFRIKSLLSQKRLLSSEEVSNIPVGVNEAQVRYQGWLAKAKERHESFSSGAGASIPS